MPRTTLLKILIIATYAITGILPVLFYVQTMLPYAIPKVVFFQGMVEVMAALWICLMVASPDHRPRKTPFSLFFALYLTILILASFLGADIGRSLWSTVDRLLGLVFMVHLGAFFFILQSIRKEINWRTLFSISVIASAFVSLGALIQSRGIHFLLYNAAERPGSTFGNAGFMAAYLLFNIFIAVWLAYSSAKRLRRIGFACIAALGVVAVFVGQTIAPIGAMLLGFAALTIFFAWRGATPRVRNVFRTFIVLIVCSALFFGITHNASFWKKIPGVSRVVQFSLHAPDVQDRMIAWRTALTAFKERPWLGWGWDNFYIPFNAHYDPRLLTLSGRVGVGTVFDKPHNILLEELVVAGIPGLLLYVLFIGALFFQLRSAEESYRAANVFFAVALGAYLLQNLTVFDTIGTYLMLVLVAGWAEVGFRTHAQSPTESPVSPARILPLWGIVAACAVAAVPVYAINIRIFEEFHYYYWGINYFVHSLPVQSNANWQKALAIQNPYIDYAAKDFTATIQQGFSQGIVFPDVEALGFQAIRYLRAAEARHPKEYIFRLVLADFYNNLYLRVQANPDYLSLAIDDAKRALTLSPNRQQIYYVLAQSYLLRSDIHEAITLMKQAINVEPDAGEPHFFYALISYQSGDVHTGDAELALAHQLGRDPRTIEEYVHLASLLGDVKHDYKAAIPFLQEAVRFAKSYNENALATEIELKLGVAYYLHGDLALAKQAFIEVAHTTNLKILPVWPSLAPVFQELGIVLP